MKSPLAENKVLQGRLVLVTGAGSRLGRALALAVAGAGADVAVHYHSSKGESEEVVAEIRELGCRCYGFQADLAHARGAELLMGAVVKKMGVPDCLVNSAGVMEKRPIGAMDVEAWDRILNLNLRAPALVISELVRCRKLAAEGRVGAEAGAEVYGGHAATARSASIVNIGDTAGLLPWSNHAHYCASKAGLVMLTKSLARELAPDGIRVNCVAPGVVLWNEQDERYVGNYDLKRALARVPMGRGGAPRDVAEAVVFLLSDLAGYITGQVLAVDGGRTVG